MSNLQVGYYDIGWRALSVTPSASISSVFNKFNHSRGYRASYAELTTATTSFSMVYDLGSSVTATANHLIIARADMLKASGVTAITLDRSSDNSSWATEHTVTSFASYDLVGPQLQDVFDTFTTSSAYRYWRVSMSGSSNKFKHSKHLFGSLFDFGSDPYAFTPEIVEPQSTVETALGNTKFSRQELPRLRYRIVWRGVTDDKVQEAFSKFLQWRMPVYLVTTTHHEILNNHKCVCCMFEPDWQVRKLADNYNEVEITFLQNLG